MLRILLPRTDEDCSQDDEQELKNKEVIRCARGALRTVGDMGSAGRCHWRAAASARGEGHGQGMGSFYRAHRCIGGLKWLSGRCSAIGSSAIEGSEGPGNIQFSAVKWRNLWRTTRALG